MFWSDPVFKIRSDPGPAPGFFLAEPDPVKIFGGFTIYLEIAFLLFIFSPTSSIHFPGGRPNPHHHSIL